ncbi:hypothetical protein [Verrucosispora sp. WMMC514]|uniref:hypothetical protein n=1 Tax=Verrucosispora sp. WMMC514 TaxID=3015156 RepID=UPI00248B2F9E|nr:hypothetical protein [Verrucosispora sp. WMMC514]WBB94322.1 hypothetical protein O7597_15850 [Verrucosispora sp. WMMC514]
MAVALLAPPEGPPDGPPDDPLPEPDEPDADDAEPFDEELAESADLEPDDEDSDLAPEPFDVVSEPEERESVR